MRKASTIPTFRQQVLLPTLRRSRRGTPMLHDARARRPSLTRRIDLIGLPTDAGASCRGAYLGPDALRAAGLPERLADIGFAVADLGDVNVGRKPSAAAEIDALAIAASEAGYRSLENG